MVDESPLRLEPSGVDAIGVPSTGLSLGGLLASRARFRFTRRREIAEARVAGKGNVCYGSGVQYRGHDDRMGCSYGMAFFCPTIGVHLTLSELSSTILDLAGRSCRRSGLYRSARQMALRMHLLLISPTLSENLAWLPQLLKYAQ